LVPHWALPPMQKLLLSLPLPLSPSGPAPLTLSRLAFSSSPAPISPEDPASRCGGVWRRTTTQAAARVLSLSVLREVGPSRHQAPRSIWPLAGSDLKSARSRAHTPAFFFPCSYNHSWSPTGLHPPPYACAFFFVPLPAFFMRFPDDLTGCSFLVFWSSASFCESATNLSFACSGWGPLLTPHYRPPFPSPHSFLLSFCPPLPTPIGSPSSFSYLARTTAILFPCPWFPRNSSLFPPFSSRCFSTCHHRGRLLKRSTARASFCVD